MAPLPSKDFCKLVDSNVVAGVYTLHRLEGDSVFSKDTIPSPFQSIVAQFEDTFKEPTQLPPRQPIDH